MDKLVTKEDLYQFRLLLLQDIKELMVENEVGTYENEWLRSKDIRRILNISPGTLQNMRVAGKLSFRKVLGSYYYNRKDLEKLFQNQNQ